MKIIAHRGGQPENTIEAFSNCTLSNFAGIEFDVWKTLDGEFVVVHNPDLKNKRIDHLTLKEINQLEPSIPTLRQTLDTIAHQATHFGVSIPLLNVEIKPFGIAEELGIWLREYIYLEHLEYTPSNFVVTSFLHTEISKFHATFPEISVGWIMACYCVNLDKLLMKHSYLSVLVLCKNAVHKEYITQLKKALENSNTNIEIWAYCTKKSLESSLQDLEYLLESSIDAYISDYPIESYRLILDHQKKELRNNHKNIQEDCE